MYVLVGGPEIELGPGNPVAAYDELLNRAPSVEPPTEPGLHELIEQHEHPGHWRARIYTGLSRDLLRRMGQHAAKPWWNRALLCRQAPPWPYGIDDIGYLEGRLHETLEAAYWVRREGRATWEDAILSNRADALEAGHMPSISAAVRLLGLALDSEEEVDILVRAGREHA